MKEAIFEIGNIIHIRKGFVGLKFWKLRNLEPKEIIDSWQYKEFRKKYPNICKLCEEDK